MESSWYMLHAALESFAITICAEGAVLVLLFSEFRRIKSILIFLLINMFTHPIYFVTRHHFFPHEHWLTGAALLEPIVFVIEALAYTVFLPIKWPKAIFASFLANATSLAVGLVPSLML